MVISNIEDHFSNNLKLEYWKQRKENLKCALKELNRDEAFYIADRVRIRILLATEQVSFYKHLIKKENENII